MESATSVGIGTFDGVHIGHQAILAEVRGQAALHGLTSAAYAFDSPPRWIRDGQTGRALLLPRHVKAHLLQASVDRVVSVSLRQIRDLSAEAFANDVLVDALHARVVVIGPRFRFGHRRAGGPETLRSIGQRFGFEVIRAAPVEIDGLPVSSTRIRQLLAAGDIPEAHRLLGRPPLLFGDVVSGDRLGRRFGYPTANVAIDEHVLLPPDGIYLAHAFVLGERRDGLLYVGQRPTVGGGELRCEVHLLDPPDRELLGEPIEIHMLERIREDRAFESIDALRHQIGLDVQRAERRLPEHPRVSRPYGS